MDRVAQSDVVETWLRSDIQKHDSQAVNVDELTEEEQISHLLRLNPGVASIFWKFSLVWYRIKITEKQFRSFRTVWRTAGVPERLMDVAQGIDENDPRIVDPLENHGVALEKIDNLDHPDGDPERESSIIVYRPEVTGAPLIADGNHRATAYALHLLRSGQYEPLTAYMGFACPQRLSRLGEKLHARIYEVLS